VGGAAIFTYGIPKHGDGREVLPVVFGYSSRHSVSGRSPPACVCIPTPRHLTPPAAAAPGLHQAEALDVFADPSATSATKDDGGTLHLPPRLDSLDLLAALAPFLRGQGVPAKKGAVGRRELAGCLHLPAVPTAWGPAAGRRQRHALGSGGSMVLLAPPCSSSGACKGCPRPLTWFPLGGLHTTGAGVRMTRMTLPQNKTARCAGTAGTAAAPNRIHVRNIREAFGRWSDATEGTQFDARMAELAVRWCCRPESVARAHNTTEYHQLRVQPAMLELVGAAAGSAGRSDSSGPAAQAATT
jgi:hypothetical protein